MNPDNTHNSASQNEIEAPFIAISRHRLGMDGDGVTTLVGFQGCPLRCKYCINMQCWSEEGVKYYLTPEELYEGVKIDDLYYRTTKGGICFGGGEPSEFPDFIKRFKAIIPPYWKITLETSLNVPKQNIETLLPVVDFWIVDIKDMNPEIYNSYTKKDNSLVLENLSLLSEAKARCLIRIPLIPEFNTKEDCRKSIETLKEMGFDKFEPFKYYIRKPKTKTTKESNQ